VTSITLRRSATDLAVKLKFASGLPGVPGEASDLQEGSVTTLDASADADFSITGTPPNQILNLSLPRGMTGPVGEGSGGLFFESRTAAASANLSDTNIKSIRTAGFASPGDGGHGLYARYPAGNPYALWTLGADYNPNDWVRNSTGTLYICKSDAGTPPAAANQPVHTTVGTTVTGADNYVWTCTALNPAYFQSADGSWWRLVPEGGRAHFAQFGGKADSDRSGVIGSDNLPAIQHAMHFIRWQENPTTQYAWPTEFDPGHYRFSDTIEVRTICDFLGSSQGTKAAGNSTFFHFPADTVCMMFQAGDSVGRWGVGPTIGNAGGSGMSNISVFGKATSTNHSLCGISVRTLVHFKHIAFYSIAGNALEMKSGSGWNGGVNGSTFWDLFFHGCSRDAIWINGGDSNVCTFEHIDIHGPGSPAGGTGDITGGVWGCGINDNSYFGNYYKGVHIAGYGNNGVSYGGRLYYFIGGADAMLPDVNAFTGTATDAAIQGAITPGTNDAVWYDAGAGAPSTFFPAWTATPTIPHRAMIPIRTSGNASTFLGVYVEAQAAPCHGPGATTARGGIAWWTRQSNGAPVTGPGSAGTASSRGFSGGLVYKDGEYSNAWTGTGSWAGAGLTPAANPEKGIVVWGHGRRTATEGDNEFQYRYYELDLVYGYADVTNSNTQVWQVTTPLTDRTFGRTDPQPYVFNPSKLALGAGTQARRVGWWNDTAFTPTGQHGDGELIFNGDTTAAFKDVLGWRCRTAGNPGALEEIRGLCIVQNDPDVNWTVAAGAVGPVVTTTVTGAQFHHPVDLTLNTDTPLILNAWVSATNTVKYQAFNPTASSVATGFCTPRLRVRK
jgi:hypothetical protein